MARKSRSNSRKKRNQRTFRKNGSSNSLNKTKKIGGVFGKKFRSTIGTTARPFLATAHKIGDARRSIEDKGVRVRRFMGDVRTLRREDGIDDLGDKKKQLAPNDDNYPRETVRQREDRERQERQNEATKANLERRKQNTLNGYLAGLVNNEKLIKAIEDMKKSIDGTLKGPD